MIFHCSPRGAFLTQVTMQNVNLTLWVGWCFWKGVIWCYAVTICIFFSDIESKLITSQNNHAQSILLLPTFFKSFTNLTALAHASKSLTLDCMSNNFFQRESLCSGALNYKWRHLYFDLQCQEYNFFATYSNWPLNQCIQSMLIRPPTPYATLSPLVFTPLPYVTLKRVKNFYDDMSYNWLTFTLCIYLNLCSPNPIIQLKHYKDDLKVIGILWHLLGNYSIFTI